jgi:hypothetical protein
MLNVKTVYLIFPEDAQYPIDKISVAKVGNRIGI